MKYQNIREKLNSNKIHFRDIIPDINEIKSRLLEYRSNIDITEYNRKLYIDPIFSIQAPEIKSTYSVLRGKWVISDDVDDIGNHIVQLTDDVSGQYIKLAFPDVVNKMKFLNELNVSHKIQQSHNNMDMASIVNENVIYPEKNIKTEVKSIVNKNKIIKYSVTTILSIIGFNIIRKKLVTQRS